jgi:cytochrome c-type biogenesis protein
MSELPVSLTLAAVGGGVAAFFAPCAFPLLPGYVGYYLSDAEADTPLGGALLRGVAASVGVLAVFAVLAVVVLAIGRALVNYLVYVEPLIGLVLVALGVAMVAGRTPTLHLALPARRTSALGFLVFGAGYAVAATGCMVGVFGAVVVEATTVSPLGSLFAVGGYAVGLSVPLVAATVAVAVGHDLATRSVSQYSTHVERVAGILIVAAGVLQLYGAAGFLL